MQHRSRDTISTLYPIGLVRLKAAAGGTARALRASKPCLGQPAKIRGLPEAIDERSITMPGKQHVRGVGAKEQRMYEHIKESAQKEGKYKGREEEVAARTVLKYHKEEGHKKGT